MAWWNDYYIMKLLFTSTCRSNKIASTIKDLHIWHEQNVFRGNHLKEWWMVLVTWGALTGNQLAVIDSSNDSERSLKKHLISVIFNWNIIHNLSVIISLTILLYFNINLRSFCIMDERMKALTHVDEANNVLGS